MGFHNIPWTGGMVCGSVIRVLMLPPTSTVDPPVDAMTLNSSPKMDSNWVSLPKSGDVEQPCSCWRLSVLSVLFACQRPAHHFYGRTTRQQDGWLSPNYAVRWRKICCLSFAIMMSGCLCAFVCSCRNGQLLSLGVVFLLLHETLNHNKWLRKQKIKLDILGRNAKRSSVMCIVRNWSPLKGDIRHARDSCNETKQSFLGLIDANW